MTGNREQAAAQFRRMVRWILLLAALTVAAALTYLAMTGELHLHMVIATVLGVFLSVLLGCGLLAASFFSNKSGHDQSVSDVTTRGDD